MVTLKSLQLPFLGLLQWNNQSPAIVVNVLPFYYVQSRRFFDLDVLEPDDWQPPCLLTDREQEILELVVDGCNNATIANHLYITVGTVKTHIRSILKKLCARDRTDAAVKALRSGLVV